MCDMFALHATARGVEKAQELLQKAQSGLGAAKIQARRENVMSDVGTTIFQIECTIAQARGVLEAVAGWLDTPGEERHP